MRVISDHNPLLLNTNIDAFMEKKNREFRFDLNWLNNEDFLSNVHKIWNRNVVSQDPIDVININMKRFKIYFKGWGFDLFVQLRKKKK